jgi:hypothetical protein
MLYPTQLSLSLHLFTATVQPSVIVILEDHG